MRRFTVWFHKTFLWWFTTLFGRLGLLFFIAAFVLVFLTYYLFNWAVVDKDNILDAHDLYYHYQLVDSWGNVQDTAQIAADLKNLQILGSIYYHHADSICTDDYIFDPSKEQLATYWGNHNLRFSLCNYISYQDSENMKNLHGVTTPAHVSFGEVMIDNEFYPATAVEYNNFKFLLVVDYIYPSEWVTFSPIIFLSFIIMFLLFLIVSRFLRPINLMQQRIIALEDGDLDSKIKIISRDELALLSNNFNSMIGEIKNLLNQKERLLSDVSHEIRTPLSKIRLLLAMEPTKEKVHKVNNQIDYLDSMVTNILISDKLSMPYSSLDLEKIKINHLINQAQDLTKHDNIVVKIEKNILICCDAVKISIVIKNLLDNAYKYAGNSPVTIKTYNKKDIIFIDVVDEGPGIEDELLANITHSYVRGANLNKSGFGLGLNICSKVMAAHKGNINITNNKNKGACFSIFWNSEHLKGNLINAKK